MVQADRQRAGKLKALAFCFAAALCLGLALSGVVDASVAWPSHDAWLQGVTDDGAPFGDPVGDFPGAPGQWYLDLVDDTAPGTGSSFAWSFDGDHLFVRIVLRGNPLHSDSLRLRNFVWLVYVNTRPPEADEGFHADYGIVLNHTGIRTTYADLSRPVTKDNVDRNTGFSSQSNGHAQGPTDTDPYRYLYHHADFGYLVRVANAAQVVPGGAADRWYLEFFLPLEWLSVPVPAEGVTPPDAVTSQTGVRLAFATSTQFNVIHKDLAGVGGDGRFVARRTVLREVRPVGPAAMLAFAEQPLDADVHATLNRIVVEVRDAQGRPVSVPSTGGVVALTLLPEGDARLGGTVTVPLDVTGRAEFDDLTVDRPGEYRLVAATDGLSAAVSGSFTIWGSNLIESDYSVKPEGPVRRGDRLTYTALIRNTGNRSTEGLTLAVTVPAEVSLDHADTERCIATQFHPETRVLECMLPPLAPGMIVQFSFVGVVGASVLDGTELISEAHLFDAWNDRVLPDAGPLVTLVRVPDLHVQLTASPGGWVAPGEEVTVKIEVVNQGGAPATDVVVRGPLQSGLQFVAGSAQGPAGVAVQFQGEDGEWYDEEFAGAGTPLKVEAIRWLLPVLEAESTAEFSYRVLVP